MPTAFRDGKIFIIISAQVGPRDALLDGQKCAPLEIHINVLLNKSDMSNLRILRFYLLERRIGYVIRRPFWTCVILLHLNAIECPE